MLFLFIEVVKIIYCKIIISEWLKIKDIIDKVILFLKVCMFIWNVLFII